MFADLDSTLSVLLTDNDDDTTPKNLKTVKVSFLTPDKNFPPQMLPKPVVNLFLHEIKENRELRDPVPVVTRMNGNALSFARPPLRVLCSYLVTTWTEGSEETDVQKAHDLLGDAFLRFSQFPTIPRRYLSGKELPPAQPATVPPPSMIAQMDGNKVFGEFWTALGVPPRPAFMLLVTIAMPFAPSRQFPPVTTIATRYSPSVSVGEDADPSTVIGGVVRDSSGKLVANATVRLQQFDASGKSKSVVDTQTDADGGFIFLRAVGEVGDTFTLQSWTSWQGPTPATPVQIPSPDGKYDLQFS